MIDSKNTALYKFKNQIDAQSETKTHTVLRIAEKYLITIDDALVQRLDIRDGDIVSQVEDRTGTIRLIFKDTKNTVTGNHHEANTQDYGE